MFLSWPVASVPLLHATTAEESDGFPVVKFIERYWHLAPLTARGRDNLPNPKTDDDNRYVPRNVPAIGDLFAAFDFDPAHDGGPRP
jgi:phospholipase C